MRRNFCSNPRSRNFQRCQIVFGAVDAENIVNVVRAKGVLENSRKRTPIALRSPLADG